MLGGLQSGLGLVVKNNDIIKLCVDSDKTTRGIYEATNSSMKYSVCVARTSFSTSVFHPTIYFTFHITRDQI